MGDTFGAKARKFMGWYTPEDAIDDVEEFEEYTDVAKLCLSLYKL